MVVFATGARRGGWAAVVLYGFACLVFAGSVARADWSLIPLPEIIVDPNEGTTVGFLPVFLVATESKTIRSIIAPDVRYNDTFGVYPTFRFFDYPDPKQKYFIMGGKGTLRGEYAEADYTGQSLLSGWLDLGANGRHEQDPFERFFGFGNETPSSNESNYTSTTERASLFTGVNFYGSFQGFWATRIREVRVGSGGVTHLPQVRDASSGFSNVNGVAGATMLGQQFGLAFDNRDAHDIPTQGVFVNSAIEIVDKSLGSSQSFIKYGFEGKAFMPLRADKKFIVALHAALDYLQHGNNAPFYEKNAIGGIHSLRAFGSGRFTDNNRFVFQSELRSNVYEREVFGVRAHLEVAPFLDIGQVFASSREFPLEDLHIVGGLGFRAVVVPQVVAYIDFGSSGGGPAAFTGIDYPF
jgi:outer membrane protein assembly factor BamA